jgi:hypothetical protein
MILLLNSGGAVTGQVFEYLEAANKFAGNTIHTVFTSGTFGSATVTIQISPDGMNPSDNGSDPHAPTNANSRWFNLTGPQTTAGYFSFTDRFRKIRAVTTGGTGSSITCEIVG